VKRLYLPFYHSGMTPIKKETKMELDCKEYQMKVDEMKRLRVSDQVKAKNS